jgi:hypothetical protein
MRAAFAVAVVIACSSHSADRVEHPLPTTKVGTGHPYWKQLAHDARASLDIPRELEPSTPPEGCFRLAADGKVIAVKLGHTTGQPAADDAVKHALDAVEHARNDKPVPVPAELRTTLDGWVCLAFEPVVTDDSLH